MLRARLGPVLAFLSGSRIMLARQPILRFDNRSGGNEEYTGPGADGGAIKRSFRNEQAPRGPSSCNNAIGDR